jgi:hypothetical protein
VRIAFAETNFYRIAPLDLTHESVSS